MLYDDNLEAYHVVLSNFQIEGKYLIKVINIPKTLNKYIDLYPYIYVLSKDVVDNIASFIDTLIMLTKNEYKFLFIDILEDKEMIEKDRISVDINLAKNFEKNRIKYILEYNHYNFSIEMRIFYEE